MAALRSFLISVALISLASQVNGNWLSDIGDAISAESESVASTLGSQQTWDKVQAAFASAGDSAANWATEAWASSEAGVKCLKDAGSDTQAILDCRTNLHNSLGSQGDSDWLSDIANQISSVAPSVANSLGSQETWDKVQAAFASAGDSAANWATEAWASSEAGLKCLKDAGSDTQAILDCRTNLHESLGGAEARVGAGAGAGAATFNLFLGDCLSLLLLAMGW